jgi:hypothetical protein
MISQDISRNIAIHRFMARRLGRFCPVFETPLRMKAQAYAYLRDNRARLTRQYFPELS